MTFQKNNVLWKSTIEKRKFKKGNKIGKEFRFTKNDPRIVGNTIRKGIKNPNANFKKGLIPWNKGKRWIEKSGNNHWNYGKKSLWLSEKNRTNNPAWKPEVREKIRQARLKQIFPVKDTYPEQILQDILTRRNIKFRVHEPLKGQPDIFIEPNICIFVDGCYWHGCPIHYERNRLTTKQLKQIEHDAKITRQLKEQNYEVWRLWEHEVYQIRFLMVSSGVQG